MYTLTCTETIEYTKSFPDMESLHRYIAEQALDLDDVTVGGSEHEIANYLAKCDPSHFVLTRLGAVGK